MTIHTPNERSFDIYIVNEVYDGDDDEGTASIQFHRGLESQFNIKFKEVNIGRGADFPAFVTQILANDLAPWLLLLGLFFAGKPIRENLEAWEGIGNWARKFFGYKVILTPEISAALAIRSIRDDSAELPRSIRLIGYTAEHVMEVNSLADYSELSSIDALPSHVQIGDVRHVFRIELDGVVFLVRTYGSKVEQIRQ